VQDATHNILSITKFHLNCYKLYLLHYLAEFYPPPTLIRANCGMHMNPQYTPP